LAGKASQVRNAELNEIRRLLGDFNSDELIMAHLKLPESTYYKYKKRIEKEDARLLAKTNLNTIKHQQMMVRRALNYVIQINRDICEDPESSAHDRRESSIVISKAYKALWELEEKGANAPEVRVITKQLINKDDKPRLTQH
jgi:hypothetical protein